MKAFSTVEKHRGVVLVVMGDRYVERSQLWQKLYSDANNLCGLSMGQTLPYKKITFDGCTTSKGILETFHYVKTEHIVGVDKELGYEMENRTKNIPFLWGKQKGKHGSFIWLHGSKMTKTTDHMLNCYVSWAIRRTIHSTIDIWIVQ